MSVDEDLFRHNLSSNSLLTCSKGFYAQKYKFRLLYDFFLFDVRHCNLTDENSNFCEKTSPTLNLKLMVE